MSDELEKQLLDKVDAARRAALKKLIIGAAYTVPVVASFAMSGLSTVAMAQPNQSNQPVPAPTLSEWAVPVFGAALGAAALAGLKKNKDA
jgi:hypothetical protein